MTEKIPHHSVSTNTGTRLQLAILLGLAQYDEIFKDKDGNYYSYPKFRSTEDLKYAKENIKGFKTSFKNKKFNLKNLSPEVTKIYYPEEFYEIKNNFAIPIKGIQLNELIHYRLKTSFKDL